MSQEAARGRRRRVLEAITLRVLKLHARRRRSARLVATADGSVAVQGAQICIVDGDRVLLQFRPFPPGWEIPGGCCEPGEDPAETAVREAREECGLEVRVSALVGAYTWAGLRTAGDAVYRGEVIGGRRHRTLESWATRWVREDELPRTAFPWLAQRVADGLHPVHPPPHRVQRVSLVNVLFFGVAWLRAAMDVLLRLTRRMRR